ncbi:MAG: hypothetical protein EXS15_05425 [Phycisphaerales bacterium]|nr:hypothetical protein [Phycisphaerales bacterium]
MNAEANTFFSSLVLAVDPIAINLLSTYKPFLVFLTVLPYAWVISTVIEQDCRKRRLKPDLWSAIGLGAMALGIATVLLTPWFWLGWPLQFAMYLAVPYAYWKFRDARVEESERFNLFSERLARFQAKRRTKRAFEEVTAAFGDSKGRFQTPPTKDAPDFETHLNAERMLVPSLPANASRVELVPMGDTVTTVQTVDTVKSRRETYAREAAVRLVDFFKVAAGLDVKERRKRQTAALHMKVGESTLKFALTTWGATAGQSIRLEFDREKQLTMEFDKTGILPIQTQTLTEALEGATGGVVLLLAPAGHGLTTLGYSILGRHNPYTTDIKTIERTVERRLEGVTQAAWVPGEAANDYATTLQSIVRRGPDVMLVSDLTDPGTGPILVNTNSKNTLFYVLLPTDSPIVAISAYIKAVGDAKAAVGALRAVVSQRLVRKLCVECRQPFQASADQAKRLGGAAGTTLQLHRASGQVQMKNEVVECPTCQGVGFSGLCGVLEVIRPDDRARELMIASDVAGAYQQMRRAFRSPLAQECALLKVRVGDSSLEEIARVFAPKAAPAANAAAGATAPPPPPTQSTSPEKQPR